MHQLKQKNTKITTWKVQAQQYEAKIINWKRGLKLKTCYLLCLTIYSKWPTSNYKNHVLVCRKCRLADDA